MLHGTGTGVLRGQSPLVLLSLGAGALFYATGFRATRDRVRPLLFAAGWIVLAIALLSPLHEAGERLLSMHMIQHVLIIAVAAPLLVWSAPVGGLLRGMPSPLRRIAVSAVRWVAPLRRRASTPAAATAIFAIVMWLWHSPVMYQASVRHNTVHALQHSSFLMAALLFWSAVPLRSHNPARHASGIMSLFVTTVHMGVLSALLTFARLPLYRVYVTHGSAAALADQQLAGVLMWVPAAIPFIVCALALVWRMLAGRDAGASYHATASGAAATVYASPRAAPRV